MKFLFRSATGDALPLARRIEAEGHQVLVWIENKDFKHLGDGLVEKTEDISSVKWADVIVFDSHGKGMWKEAELWRKTKPVFGSSEFANKLEHDREFGMQAAKSVGMKVPEHKRFKGAGAFVKAAEYMLSKSDQEDNGWVWKPMIDELRTHVSRDTPEMVRMLKVFEHAFEDAKSAPDFIIEKRIKGIEVSTEGWWNGKEFSCCNGTIEENRLFEHDLGEQVGCAGNVVWAYDGPEYPLLERQLLPLGKVLGHQYHGPVDVNTIVDSQGEFWFLEFTPRLGISAIFAFLELVEDAAGLVAQIARGEQVRMEPRTDEFAIGLGVSIPPYPVSSDDKELCIGLPVFGFDYTVVDKHIGPVGVLLNKDGEIETAGTYGVVFEITQTGTTIHEAAMALYPTIKTIYVPNMRYRTDIGEDAENDFRKLKGMGLVRSPRGGYVFASAR